MMQACFEVLISTVKGDFSKRHTILGRSLHGRGSIKSWGSVPMRAQLKTIWERSLLHAVGKLVAHLLQHSTSLYPFMYKF